MTRIPHSLLAAAVLTVALAVPAIAATKTFKATLKGSEEVPPRATNATGHLTLSVSSDMTSVAYKLTLGNIENVTAAHLHMGGPGENGGVVAQLFGPAAPGGGRSSGMLANGTLTAANLTGDLAGKTIADLVAAIEAGRIYVNVHTDDGNAGTSDRSGDFSEGEIRGQVN